MSESRRRARAEAARSESVWVRLSPEEAAAVGEAADRANMSVGAWVGETAVGRARAHARGDNGWEVDQSGPSSWRELVAALVALRAEVSAARRDPVVGLDPDAPAPALLDDRSADDPGGADRNGADGDGVVGVLRRIDAVTATAVEAALSGAQSSRGAGRERVGRERSGRS